MNARTLNERMELPDNFWKWMMYLSGSVLMLWTFLKITGIINTPEIILYGVPITSGMAYIFTMHKDLLKELTAIKSDISEVKAKVFHIDRDLERIKTTPKTA